MSAPKCSICSKTMVINGKTAAGKQRWKCRRCKITQAYKINSDAKQLESFLKWLLSRARQCDMTSAGRSFKRMQPNKSRHFLR